MLKTVSLPINTIEKRTLPVKGQIVTSVDKNCGKNFCKITANFHKIHHRNRRREQKARNGKKSFISPAKTVDRTF